MYRMTVEDEIRHDALKEGIMQGIQQGMQQGGNKRNSAIVLNMVAKGFDIQTISQCTDLDIAEVQKIRDNS